MPVDVTSTLRDALSNLTAEKRRIERQAAAIEEALRAVNGTSSGQSRSGRAMARHAKSPRRPMSAATRKAVSAGMKAYWAKRKGGASKEKRKKV